MLALTIIFTWHSGASGDPIVGEGSESDPIIVGVTSKQLFGQFDSDPSTYVMLIDAMYKPSQVPTHGSGVSDRMLSFRVIVSFFMSQQEQNHFMGVLTLI
ncbi:hypothetical protein L917_20726 [Phytophthora nicotianae]|uniref:Uncharacterized protein n=1 Tax=Phytophthora nicotianae TaxID=4792 RepID=W2K201_PHYNI|nr:hypothetical protein L917_20726 [Phytophthora nicotianae]